MPTYDYRCNDCGHEFEFVQKMSDSPLTDCPECKGNLKRLIGTGAGIIFKGSGFYQTDYRSDKYKQAAAKEKSGGGDSASKPSESKSPESKPSESAASPPKKEVGASKPSA